MPPDIKMNLSAHWIRHMSRIELTIYRQEIQLENTVAWICKILVLGEQKVKEYL